MTRRLGIAIVACVLLVAGAAVAGDSSAGPPFVAGQLVVQGGADQLDGFQVVKVLPRSGLTVVAVSSGQEWGQLQRFRERGVRAHLNLRAEKFAVPNDPLYSPYQWHLTRIQSEPAWDLTTGAGAVVAVLDSGLAPGGPDGIGCVVAGYDMVNGDSDPFDGDGHGTHVSGTVAQRTNNGIGVAGMAWGACVMPVKVLDDSGSGSFADIAEGIYWAVDHGADVINMSLGINARYNVRSDPVMDPALDYAYSQGVTVVCAAGNDGWRKNVSYPAIYPTTIAVGATDYADQKTSYSNYGYGLDLMAPGGNSAADLNGDGYGDGVLQETLIPGEGWGYWFFDGTSMASPHVAAVAALLIADGVASTPDEVYQALITTTIDLGDPGYDSKTGFGLVQAYAALGGGGGCTDADGDGACVPFDCDDSDPDVFPGATEVCDGVDNNCDGTIDEGCGGSCFPAGDPCTTNADCCSLMCHPRKLTCK